MFRKTCAALCGTLLAATTIALPAAAQEAGEPAPQGDLRLELNNAQAVEGGCRLTYVAENETGVALTQAAYEVAVFDTDGGVSRLLIFEFGNLAKGKTKVVQFDIADQPCDDISRLLVNSVSECTTAEGEYDRCMSALKPSSRAEMDFGV